MQPGRESERTAHTPSFAPLSFPSPFLASPRLYSAFGFAPPSSSSAVVESRSASLQFDSFRCTAARFRAYVETEGSSWMAVE